MNHGKQWWLLSKKGYTFYYYKLERLYKILNKTQMIRYRILRDLLRACFLWKLIPWPLTFHLRAHIAMNKKPITCYLAMMAFLLHHLSEAFSNAQTVNQTGKRFLSPYTQCPTILSLNSKRWTAFGILIKKSCTVFPSPLESIPSQGKTSIRYLMPEKTKHAISFT